MKGIQCLEIVSNPAFLEHTFSLFDSLPSQGPLGVELIYFDTSRMHINDSKFCLYEQWQCFASFIYLFKHKISIGCEMAVNFLNVKLAKNFYLKLKTKGQYKKYIPTHPKSMG